MLKKTSKRLCIFALFLCSITIYAPMQSESATQELSKPRLIFSAALRTRYESQHNFSQKYYGINQPAGKSDDSFLLYRIRAGLDWHPSKKTHLALWMQHADVLGYELPDSAFYNNAFKHTDHPHKDRFELYQTFIETKDIMHTGISLKAGRQKISYADNRVFGPGEWGNSGRWVWDALKTSWSFKHGFLDLFYGKTMLHEIDQFSLGHRHGYESIGMYGHVNVLKNPVNLIVEPMLFTKKDNHQNYTGELNKTPGKLDSWYLGARTHASLRNWELGATFIQEKGSFGADKINAYGYHIMAAYTVPHDWKPRLCAAYSYASGDSNPADGKNETFHEAFGAKDMFYGRMNLFSWSNLKDYEISMTINPYAWLTIKGEAHKFKLADKHDGWSLNSKTYRDKTVSSGESVGKELDLVISCRYSNNHTLMAGFGRFWPDEFAKNMASSKQASWVFLQWEYRFSKSLL
ncbi:MAG: alginate export family protein [Nitrospirae bacterium]|nr:alginate export family protein [Nitrospirota bacterium]